MAPWVWFVLLRRNAQRSSGRLDLCGRDAISPDCRVASTEAPPVGSARRPICIRATGKLELKDGPPRAIRHGPDATSMRLDDRTANRQTHAHAAGFCRVKRIEHALSVVCVESLAPISYRHEHAVRGGVRGGDQQLWPPISSSTRRFDRVDNQVPHDLLQLNPISLNERQMLGELGLNQDAILPRFATGEYEDLAERIVDIQAGSPRGHLLDEGANPADHLAGPSSTADDSIERLPYLVQIRWLGVKPAQSSLGAVDRADERLIDLVGDRSGQLPHGGNPICMRQFHLYLAVALLALAC